MYVNSQIPDRGTPSPVNFPFQFGCGYTIEVLPQMRNHFDSACRAFRFRTGVCTCGVSTLWMIIYHRVDTPQCGFPSGTEEFGLIISAIIRGPIPQLLQNKDPLDQYISLVHRTSSTNIAILNTLGLRTFQCSCIYSESVIIIGYIQLGYRKNVVKQVNYT